MTRFIKLPNSFYEKWEGYPKVVALAVHLLFKAARKDGTIAGQEILRGQLLTSLPRLSEEIKLTYKEVRNALDLLKKANFLGTTSGRVKGRFKGRASTIVTICDYDSYSGLGQSRGRTEGTTSGRVRAGFKENPPYNPHKELLEKKKERITKVIPKKESDAPFFAPPNNDKPIEENPAPREENSNPQPPSSRLTPEDVMQMWNTEVPELPKIRLLTESRKAKVKARLREFGDDPRNILLDIFAKMNDSDFLRGRDAKWKATFDWLFGNEKNWLKVLEGNYDNLNIKQEHGNTSRSDPYVRRRSTDVENAPAEKYYGAF